MADEGQQDLREALKAVAVALKREGVPFALMGGYAVWARGGPEPDHDVDILVAEEDAGEAARVLAEGGFHVVHPAEDWLFKVFVDDALVDVIFRASGVPADRELLARATEEEVLSVQMPVLPATELVVQRLNAMREHYCDFAAQLPVARALREQVDWDEVRRVTAENDFAAALLFLLERLRIIGPEGSGRAPEGAGGQG